jgi:hypothetical protein
VTKNSAPRNVYTHKLEENSISDLNTIPIGSLFKGSMAHCFEVSNQYDLIIVDEAHRLMNGTQDQRDDDQMKKLINAAKTIVFFIDENQRVSLDDAGTIDGIKERAHSLGCAEPIMDELVSQFLCNGSTEYLRWLDNLLQIERKAVPPLSEIGYDFDVMDTPKEVMDFIRKKNTVNNKSRVVAGYCWTWKSRKAGLEKENDMFPFSINIIPSDRMKRPFLMGNSTINDTYSPYRPFLLVLCVLQITQICTRSHLPLSETGHIIGIITPNSKCYWLHSRDNLNWES